MVIYDSASIYIASKKTLKERIQAIDQILLALDSTELDAALNENKTMYMLDDGQTKIQMSYRGIEGIERARLILEQRKQRYINEINGRNVRLIDGHSINRPFYPYGGR